MRSADKVISVANASDIAGLELRFLTIIVVLLGYHYLEIYRLNCGDAVPTI
jgi:hypothetical protein